MRNRLPIFIFCVLLANTRSYAQNTTKLTIAANHQSKEGLASQIGRVPKGQAMYEVFACGEPGTSISTAEIRVLLGRKGLSLASPDLSQAVIARERERGLGAKLKRIPELAPVFTLAMAAGDVQNGAVIGAGIMTVVAWLRSGRDPRPIDIPDPSLLIVGESGCSRYLTFAKWPKAGGPQFVEATVEKQRPVSR